jgi:hypothetical protein
LIEVADLPSNGSLELFDLTGQLLNRQAIGSGRNQILEVKIGDLPRGMYLYRLQSGGKTGAGKIIKE